MHKTKNLALFGFRMLKIQKLDIYKLFIKVQYCKKKFCLCVFWRPVRMDTQLFSSKCLFLLFFYIMLVLYFLKFLNLVLISHYSWHPKLLHDSKPKNQTIYAEEDSEMGDAGNRCLWHQSTCVSVCLLKCAKRLQVIF